MSATKIAVTSALLTSFAIVTRVAVAQAGPTNTVLDKITVTANPVEVVHEAERTVYDIGDNLLAKTGSVSDVLGTLPSVNVAPNGSVSVGGASVAVLVDGKPSPLFRDIGMSLAEALQSMPANSIAKIEVITNPGPEFRMDRATIINLITKKPQSMAPKGDLTISAGSRGRLNGTLSGSYAKEKWTVTGNGGARKDLRYDILDTNRIAKNPDGTDASRQIEHRQTSVPYTSLFGSATTSYIATEQDTISFGAEGALNHRPRNYIDYRRLMATDGTITSDIVTLDQAEQHFDQFSVTGDYVRKELFGGDKLTVKLKHEDYDTLRDFTDVHHFISPPMADSVYSQARSEQELIDTLSGDYVLSTKKDHELKVGFEVEADRDQTFQTIRATMPGINEAARFDLDRTLYVAYGSYRLTRDKWTIKGGVRGEAMWTRFAQDMAASTTLYDLQCRPNLSINRELTPDSALSLNYSRRIDRPTAYQLNPLPTVVISVTDVGNPYLEPGETQSLDIGYSYAMKPVTLKSTAYVRRLNNQIVSYQFAPTPGDTTLINSYVNAGSGAAAGLGLAATLRVSAKWDISLSSDLYHVRQSVPVAGIAISNATFTHLTKLGVAWTPGPSNTLQAQGQLRGPSLLVGGTQSGYGFLDMSYSHTFTPRLKLIVTAKDVLDTVRYQGQVDTTQYSEQSELYVPGQVIYVGLTYKLGAAGAEK